MNPEFENYLLKVTNARVCKEVEVIQSLWSGYGKISRYKFEEGDFDSVVVKHIALDQANNHPRGWNTDIGHQRKVHSYEVEIQWYKHWNQHCNDSCRTARFMGSLTRGQEHWIILEDLNTHFPVRKQNVDLTEAKTCLKWLANFHATYMQLEPTGLWEIGTYWHLATRPEEYGRIKNLDLKNKACEIDSLLNQCTYQTIVHGDAKLANFCFSNIGEEVAAVDFQYVGAGCGMKDVAYFLGSCLTSNQLNAYAELFLAHYFIELKKAISRTKLDIDFRSLEREWRNLYPIAWTDFTRFMLGWMPSHQKVNDYSLKLMQDVLTDLDEQS